MLINLVVSRGFVCWNVL